MGFKQPWSLLTRAVLLNLVRMKGIGFWILGILMLTGCEKAVDFKLDEAPPKLVVEATIETNQAPFVVLSTSLNYFSEITPAQISNSFARGADVEMSNGTQTHKLKEYGINLAPGYTFYYYSIDSSNLSSAFVGETGKRYSMKINFEGQEYTSQTTIPVITRRIDSLYWKPAPADTSDKVIVMVRATDAPGFGDYIRYWTKRNNEDFLPGLNSVYDDLVIDGATYEVEVEPGIERNNFEFNDDSRAFRRGDTVTLKLAQIDKATYDFWRTMEYSYLSIGNPFSSPIKVLGNISNGALGYFGGYAPQFRTIIIER
jgi:hypothetical protein